MQPRTDPSNPDTDGDGVNDGAEITGGLNPLNPDTDQDGLLDGVETNTFVFVDETDTGSDPLFPDSDNDGWEDGLEVFHGANPTDFNSVPTFSDVVPVVDLNAADLDAGLLQVWPNSGAMTGDFATAGTPAPVESVAGGIAGIFPTMTMARVRVYGQALTAEQVAGIHSAEAGAYASAEVELHAELTVSGGVQLSWNAAPGASYAVEFSSDLQNWFELAAGQTAGMYTDQPAPETKRFYRLRVE